MADLKIADVKKISIEDFSTADLLAMPLSQDEYCQLKLSADRISLKESNANPGITTLEPVNALALLEESVSLSDIQKIDALAATRGLTQSELLRRWAKVLLYFMGYIDNPAPSE
jgi:hypothetical protein